MGSWHLLGASCSTAGWSILSGLFPGTLRSGRAKGFVLLSPPRYAYIEFEEQSSVKVAVALDESVFRGRVIKVRLAGVTGGLSSRSVPGWAKG